MYIFVHTAHYPCDTKSDKLCLMIMRYFKVKCILYM